MKWSSADLVSHWVRVCLLSEQGVSCLVVGEGGWNLQILEHVWCGKGTESKEANAYTPVLRLAIPHQQVFVHTENKPRGNYFFTLTTVLIKPWFLEGAVLRSGSDHPTFLNKVPQNAFVSNLLRTIGGVFMSKYRPWRLSSSLRSKVAVKKIRPL